MNFTIVFIYSGMGGEWKGMGKELYSTQKVFREAIDHIDSLLKSMNEWSLTKELFKEQTKNRITNVEYSQLANFAIQYGLTKLWNHHGITSDIVIGHSYGETMAFVESRIISLKDAINISALRGKYQQKFEGKGKMLAIWCSKEEIDILLEKYNVSLAAINGDESYVLSGSNNDIEQISLRFPEKTKLLQVNIPYHHPLLSQIDKNLLNWFSNIKFNIPQKRIISTVTGNEILNVDLSPMYAIKNSQQCVLFKNAIEKILSFKNLLFIEISPHPVLVKDIYKIALTNNLTPNIIYSIKRGQKEWSSFKSNLNEVLSIKSNILV